MRNFASDQYWNTTNEKQVLNEASTKNPLHIFLSKNLEQVSNLTAFEIGCFPGTFLPVIGNKGYVLNGIDISPRTSTNLKPWLENKGYKCHKICSGNIFDNNIINEKFDLVCSFGFIEHFDKYDEVILKHIELSKKGGKIIITAPNFKGIVQYLFHLLFDKTNFLRHNTESMDPTQWKRILESNGCKVMYYGWFGGFDLWREKDNVDIFRLFLIKIVFLFMRIIRKINFRNSRHYSPFCGIIAEKL